MDSREKLICNWRITTGVPSGLHLWFDPMCESVRLYRVPTTVQRPYQDSLGSLDAQVGPGYLDKVGSVSEVEPEAELASERYKQIVIPELDVDLPF